MCSTSKSNVIYIIIVKSYFENPRAKYTTVLWYSTAWPRDNASRAGTGHNAALYQATTLHQATLPAYLFTYLPACLLCRVSDYLITYLSVYLLLCLPPATFPSCLLPSPLPAFSLILPASLPTCLFTCLPAFYPAYLPVILLAFLPTAGRCVLRCCMYSSCQQVSL